MVWNTWMYQNHRHMSKDANKKFAWPTKKFRSSDLPAPEIEVFKKSRDDQLSMYPEKEIFPGEFSTERPKGKIYDKKPFKIYLEAGKIYAYCTCGWSHTQPICDGQHKIIDGTSRIKKMPKMRPIRFTVEESKEYWLCNCKQSNNRPYCDGTHKRQDIQDAIKS